MSDKSAAAGLFPLRDAKRAHLPKDEEIYQSIYTAIVEHHLAPGTKLPEDALAEVFDVSRTSIRKALLRLSHESLVTLQPNRGAIVAKPTIEEARQVFAARRLLEAAAMEMIVACATPSGIEGLRELVREEQAAQQRRDYRAAIRLSGAFHQALMGLSGNEPLSDFLRKLVSRSSLIIAVYGSPVGARGSCSEHMELVELLAAGQARPAREWMERHLQDIEGTLDFGAGDEEVSDLKKIFSGIRGRPAS